MRKYARLMLLLLLFAVSFPFVYPWRDGKPLLSWSALTMPSLPEVSLPPIATTSERGSNQPVTLFRWRDASGGVQYGNTPPPQGTDYEEVRVNPDANLLPAVAAEASGGDEPASPAGASQLPIPSPLTVSPAEAAQLIEDARQLREASKERLRQQQELAR